MLITRTQVAEKLNAYLHHSLSPAQLVSWAEESIMNGDFDSSTSRDVTARIGLADVREFSLAWEDCEQMLADLGYTVHIEVAAA